LERGAGISQTKNKRFNASIGENKREVSCNYSPQFKTGYGESSPRKKTFIGTKY
jgi:hypothetical protein